MLNKVNHKVFGVGEIVSREEKENSVAITVRFDDGKEIRCSIPQSFESGMLTAEGSLLDEVNELIAARKKRMNIEPVRPVESVTTGKSSPRTRKSSARNGIDVIASTFEEYLIKSGYSVETPSGSPSTVTAYIKAVDSVVENERISWGELQNNISDIVKKYDVGGKEEEFGSRSNKTVLYALKAFQGFINP